MIHQNHAVSWMNQYEVPTMTPTSNEPSLTLSDIEAQIADAEHRIDKLQDRLSLLNEFRSTLRSKPQRIRLEKAPNVSVRVLNGSNQSKPGISQGLRDFIAEHPFKYKRSEIIEIVRNRVETKAKDPASSMFSTLWQWVQQGKIEVDSEGRVGPKQIVHTN